MANLWLANALSAITSATLGDLTGSKVRVTQKDVIWDTTDSGGYLFSQSGATDREFGLFSIGGNLNIFSGGEQTQIMTAAQIASFFGSSTILGLIDFELDLPTGDFTFKVNDTPVVSGTADTGTSRIDGVLFRIGARSLTDTSATTSAFIVPSGTKIGDTDVYIDDTLVRSYAMPITGTNVPESVSSAVGTLQDGTGGGADWEAAPTGVVAPVLSPIYAINKSQSSAMTFTGVFFDSPDDIEFRVMQGGGEVITWASVDSFSFGTYTVSTPVVLDIDTAYTIEVRDIFSGSPVDTDTSEEFDVGLIVAFIGSSSSERVFSQSTGTTDGRVHVNTGTWATVDNAVMNGESAVVMANDIFTNIFTGSAVGFYDFGVGSTKFEDWVPGQTDYDAFIDAVSGIDELNISCVISMLGFNNADETPSVNPPTNEDNTSLVDNIRASLLISDLPFLVVGSQRDGDATLQNAEFVALWTSERNVSNVRVDVENIWRHDLEISGDNTHLTQSASNTAVLRMSQWSDWAFASASYYRGPQIINIIPSGVTVDVILDGSDTSFSDFTPTSSIAGFQVNDDGVPLTLSTQVRLNGSTIRLTTTTAPTGVVTVDFAGYNANVPATLAFTNYPLGNDAKTLPIEPLFTSIMEQSVAPALITPYTDQSNLIGSAVDINLTTNYDNTSTFTVTGLPAGLSSANGIITGTVTAPAGAFTVTVVASTGSFVDPPQTFTWYALTAGSGSTTINSSINSSIN